MIRTLVPDVLRYGDHSRLGESIYDFPHQWGSKRTGPDLARVGNPNGDGNPKYSNAWHFQHMANPRMIEGSNMPNYPWLFTQKTESARSLVAKLAVQRMLGVPYPDYTEAELAEIVDTQAKEIVADLRGAGAQTEPDREIVALIAYLQKLGKYETVTPVKTATK